ncbi:MAG: hypothetical protein JXR49_17510 [Acidobacteria bacterium]|nr:hypothetical protein [Acidobacteriota bacterium]
MPCKTHKIFVKSLYTFIVFVLLILPASAPTAQTVEGNREGVYSVLDPRGIWPRIERIPLSPRPSSLDGKRIYMINSWGSGTGFEDLLPKIAEVLRERHPGIAVTIKGRNTGYSSDDPELWQEMQANADAFIYAGAPSSSTTSYAFKWSAKLEKLGLPGAVLMFDTLLSVAETTRKREGAEVRYVAIPFPAETMSRSQENRAIDDILACLTLPLETHEQRIGYIEAPETPRIMTSGSLDEIQEYFYSQGMSDGLPIIPPTEARVAAMLRGTSLDPNTVVVKAMMPEGLGVTVEKVAVNAVMAGCEPRHLPVLLATLEAYDKHNLNSLVRSTNAFSFMQVVNGPVRRELEMNAGTSVLGPGNHANAAMGRALHLFIKNLGGGVTGINMMAVVGNISTWPFMFPEFEEQSPWQSLSMSQGYKREDNTLTMFTGGWAHAGNYGHVRFTLDHVAADIAEFEFPVGAVIILSPKRAEILKAQGFTKQAIADYLVEHATKPLGELRTSHYFRDTPDTVSKPDNEAHRVFSPGSIHIVVAGGNASPMMQAWHMYRPITVSIDKWR